MSTTAYHVPGVYFEPQPRAPEPSLVRTDIVGFIGFEPRVRNGTTPSVAGTGHAFRVDIAAFQHLARGEQGMEPPPDDFSFAILAQVDYVLSEAPTSSPILSGQSIIYALVVAQHAGVSPLHAVAGDPAVSGGEAPPSDAIISAVPGLGDVRWQRFAHVSVRRQGNAVFVTARPTPRFCITRCDDFRDYALAFGEPPDDGTLLGPSVRAFFANGGRRCWVATVRRPAFEDHVELARVLDDMIGIPGSSEIEATGLERLLLLPDVTVVDVPDLYALRVDRKVRSFPLPPSEREACFLPCDEFPPKGTATSNERTPAWTPIFDSLPVFPGGVSEVFQTQVELLLRCARSGGACCSCSACRDCRTAAADPYVPPTEGDAREWVKQFDVSVKQQARLGTSIGDTESVSVRRDVLAMGAVSGARRRSRARDAPFGLCGGHHREARSRPRSRDLTRERNAP